MVAVSSLFFQAVLLDKNKYGYRDKERQIYNKMILVINDQLKYVRFGIKTCM